jgi:predicted Kef-type K+ transport protein
VKSLYYIIPIGLALFLISNKVMAKKTALKNLSIKLKKFKFNLNDTFKTIKNGYLSFDVSFDVINTVNEQINVNNLFLNLFVTTSKVATLSLHTFKLNANGSTTLNATTLIKINYLPQIIKDIYNDLKEDLDSSSYLSIPGKVIAAINTIQNEIGIVKSKLSIKGSANIEGLDFIIDQKLL